MRQRKGSFEMGHAGRLARKKSLVALTVGLLIAIGALAWPFTKAHLQAVAILQLVSGQKVPWIISKLVTMPVRTEEVNFATGAGVVRGRLYLPDGQPGAPGLVVLQIGRAHV